MRNLKFASVGGWQVHTDRFIEKTNNYPGCKVSAVWDPDTERGKKRAKKFECEYVSAYEEILNDATIDGVLITSPTKDHFNQISKALRAGKHVFVEKPAFCTVEEGNEIRNLLKETELSFVISDPIRTSKRQLLCAKELMNSGRIGTVTMARTRCAAPMAMQNDHPDNLNPELSGGGIMYDPGCHTVHMLNLLLGKPRKVHAAFSAMSMAATKYGVEDTAVAVYEFDHEVLGIAETSGMAERREDFFLISGTEGSIICLDKELRLRESGRDWVTIPQEMWPEEGVYPLYGWIDSIRDNSVIKEGGIEDAIIYTEMICGAYEAAKQFVTI